MAVTRTVMHLHLPRYARGEAACLSVKVGNAPTHYRRSLYLVDVRFFVQPAGRARYLATGVRNVHAGLRGVMAHPAWTELGELPTLRRAEFRPGYESFIDSETGEPVTTAARAYCVGNRVYYMPSEA